MTEQPAVVWRKSSRSATTANCVEVALNWQKSSYSNSSANCVEVAPGGGFVGVRDSKSPETGVLVVSARRWADFLSAVRGTGSV
ncbi:DUF397 domain-containing protein [Saccharopolyspora sp. NFXS83]|uniref:DUF397 domain-containing protein n=1 Tax=Saccharopolyspora sp. NFXS83 TaxID=2993560 RepID=UPI00224A67F9|nr:DUF397 domain-containing protein [Saccharopolyspora sp. NFXS83]MCX2733632.1 DUF397 domain-containing protein [Saccharopolyspora sp. NFXS83]